MSLRPHITGIDLSKLEAIFGSKDEKMLKDLLAIYQKEIFDDYLGEMDHDKVSRVFIKDLVFGKTKPSKEEGRPIFTDLLTKLFIHYGQDVVWTDSDMWKRYFMDYFTILESLLVGRGRELISYFLGGRPLFGKHIAPTTRGTYYCYLTRREVGELLTIIEKNKEVFYDEEGFGEHFHKGLKKIYAADKDLFYFS